jgi:hypothetical protein
MMKRIVQNIKTKKIEKSEHFLRRPYEKKKKKIKKSRLRAFARTRAKNEINVHAKIATLKVLVRKVLGYLISGVIHF